jgi:hypothetical protein
MPRLPTAVVLVGAALVLVSEAVEISGYSWFEITQGASIARLVTLLAIAALVLVDLGGRAWRTTFLAAAAANVLLGLIALAKSAAFVGPVIAGAWLAAMTAYALGVGVAAVQHRRADGDHPMGVPMAPS